MVAQYSESYHRGLRLLFFRNLMWERFFDLTENKTTLQREMWGGLTTFMTSAYIIFVQPAVLSATGMDFGAVFVATCIASGIATVMMALFANYPIAVAPAM